ncbi:MAG: V4R domain-containing protein [Nanobdellota archaeon]
MITKKLKFKDGAFSWDGQKGVTLPADVFASFIELVENIYGDDGRTALYDAGWNMAFSENPLKRNKFTILEHLNQRGLGQFSFTVFDLKKPLFYIKSVNDPIETSFKKIYGLQQFPMNSFVAGYFAGLFSRLLDSELKCEEKECRVQGKKQCLFKISV